jgi:hypothetical protein
VSGPAELGGIGEGVRDGASRADVEITTLGKVVQGGNFDIQGNALASGERSEGVIVEGISVDTESHAIES